MCGLVDDTRPANGDLACLKVAQSGGQLFTATPPEALLDWLGYVQSTDPDANDGKTYARLDLITAVEGRFGAFNYLRSSDLINTQASLWCQNLSSLKFEGRANWRIPEEQELRDFYADKGDMRQFGWPVSTVPNMYYWSATIFAGFSKQSTVNLANGIHSSADDILTRPVACVSAD